MKKRIYRLIIIMVLFFSIPSIKANCTNEEIATLKKEANKIKIEYEHIEDVGITESIYNLEVKSITNKFYVILDDIDKKYSSENNDNLININSVTSGKHVIKIYSSECGNLMNTISFRLSKINSYYYDPLCIGIDGEDFELCNKYYDYDVTYDDFKQRVERYRYINKIGDDDSNKNNNDKDNIFNIIYNYIINNKMYFLIGMGVLVGLILLIILIRSKKNRSVLK